MDYDYLSNTFCKIYSSINSIVRIYYYKQLENIDTHEKNKIIEQGKIFLKVLDKIKDQHILLQGFIDKNYTELVKLNKIFLDIKMNEGISLSDKIFKSILKFNKNMPLGITITFEEFIKGISYFSNETEKQIPIYHRASSCGNKRKNFREIIKNNNDEEKRNKIYKCYLERLIYDHMYNHLLLKFPTKLKNQNSQQNNGHLYQLTERSKNYYNHFLGKDIKIEIFYEYDFPVFLTVYFMNGDKVEKIEKFMKTTFIDDYGNTQYSENVYVTTIQDGIETFNVQQF